MVDERIVVRASLRDRLTEPLKRVEEQALKTGVALRSMCGNTDCLDDHANSAASLATRVGALEGAASRAAAAVSDEGEAHKRSTRAKKRHIGVLGRLTALFGRGRKAVRGAIADAKTHDKALARSSKMLTKWGKAWMKFGPGIGMLMGMLKIGAIVAAIGPASSLLGALVAGAVAGVQAMAPLAGLVAALPAGIFMLVTSVAALKLAFAGLGKAVGVLTDPAATIDQVNAAMKGLTPEAQHLARVLAGYKPITDGIKRSVQQGLFPGVESMLAGLATLAPVVQRGMAGVGAALGGAARQAGAMFRSPMFSADLGTIMDSNTRNVGNASSALVYLLSAVRHIMVAAVPFANYIGDLALAFGHWADRTAEVNRVNGDTGRFLDKTMQRMRQFGHIIRDFAVAFANIFRMATPMADDGTASLEKMAAHFRAWTESAEGIRKVTGWFDAMRPVLVEAGKLLRQFTFGFFTLSQESSGTTVTLLKRLQEIGPLLHRLLAGAANSPLLDSLLSIVGSLAAIAAVIPFKPMAEFIGLIARLVGWIAQVTTSHTVFGAVLRGVFQTLLLGVFAIKAVGFAFTVAGAILRAFQGIMLLVRTAVWLVNLALAANPIGLVVVAAIALGVAFYELWKHSETFRNAVKALGDMALDVFGWILDKVLDVVDAIGRIDWPSPPDWMKGGGWKILPGVGDTASPHRPRAIGDTATSRNFGHTMRRHAEITGATGARPYITNAFTGGGGKGWGSGDHQRGYALDLKGSGLQRYAQQVRALGGYAAFHGDGPGRHLHAVYGDTPRTKRPHLRERPQLRHPMAMGDTLRPVATRTHGGGGDTQIVVQEGAIQVIQPASGIDLRREIAAGLAEYERERRERA